MRAARLSVAALALTVGVLLLAHCGSVATPSGATAPTATTPRPPDDAAVPAAEAIVMCLESDQAYRDQVRSITARWDDGVELAASTPRANLAPVVSELQAIRREAELLTGPDCASGLSESIAGSMDATIDLLLALMRDAPEAEILDLTRASRYSRQVLDEHWSALGEGRAPRPVPTLVPEAVEVTYLVDGTAAGAALQYDDATGENQYTEVAVPAQVGPFSIRLPGQARVYVRRLGETGVVSCAILVDGVEVASRECLPVGSSCLVTCIVPLKPSGR